MYICPLLSSPAIIEILGTICSCGTELVVSTAYHFRRRKSHIPSQVSSILRTVFPACSSSRNFKANYCLHTRFLSLLACIETGKIFLKRIFRSFFMMEQTSPPVVVILCCCSKDFFTAPAESIIVPSLFIYHTISAILALWFSTASLFSTSIFSSCWFFYCYLTSLFTTPMLTLCSFATAVWVSCSTNTWCIMLIF